MSTLLVGTPCYGQSAENNRRPLIGIQGRYQAPRTALTLPHLDRIVVAAGRCELICGCQPDLLIDGRWCYQNAAHQLAAAGLLGPGVSAPTGALAPAVLTESGRALLLTA